MKHGFSSTAIVNRQGKVKFYLDSKETSQKSSDEINENKNMKPEFLGYSIYYLGRNDYCIWINLPHENNELVTEIIVQKTQSPFKFRAVYYFENMPLKDSLLAFEFAQAL